MNLPQVTLLTITDEKKYEETLKAVDFSCSKITFGDVSIISNVQKSNNYKHINHDLVKNLDGYNRICINHLHELVETEFCLLVQWDGFIINHNLWTDDFLNYDYIGAPWDHAFSKNRVGNGGFSLRSRKFLEASSKLRYNPQDCEWLYDWQKQYRDITPEDWFLCYENYEYMLENDIKFPSAKLAANFSIEYPLPCHPFVKEDISTYNSFGFHGSFNTGAMSLL
jgi:hypothetical protein